MQYQLLKSKLHAARVTGSALDYEGSLTIDENLMQAIDLLPYEKILVANMENANRFETYVIKGTAGSGEICLNGATARLGTVGDRLIIFSFCTLPESEARNYQPRVLRLDERNRPESTPAT